jgi:hypothetical protein
MNTLHNPLPVSFGKTGEEHMKTVFRKTLLGFAAALAISGLAAGEVSAAPAVTSGFDPSATLTGAVRYRNFNSGGGAEIWVGVSPLAVPPASAGDVAWGSFPFSKCVQFTYNGSGTLTTKVASVATPCSFTSATTVTKSGLTLGTLNYLEITFTKNTQTTSMALIGVSLGADTLGNLAVNSRAAGTTKWKVTGADLTSGFTLTGAIAVAGTAGGGDSNHVELAIGSVLPSDTEGPITSNVAVTPSPVILNGQATVTATVDDSTMGGNTISSADSILNGGADTAMSAQDGVFNAVSEEVETTFTATEIGLNEVCVHGTDSLNNVGDPTCQSFLVTYKFDGFFSPIDNDFLNVAKAGQAIPAKWRLTDANGVPILDPASFVNFSSYPISCTDLQGDSADSVEEYAAGSSGLQNLGDGYWQFNWKTPKDYANTCRAMYVVFDSGATSPVAKVQFKK